MSWLRLALGGMILLVTLVWLVGMAVPRHHVTSRSALLARPPAEVWAVLSDFAGFARWAPDVSGVTRLPDQDGHPVYALEGKWPMPLAVEALEAPRRMVTRIADPTLPFGGTWTWELAPEGSGTRVTVTEDGEIKAPPMRTLMLLFGYHSTLDSYLKALGERFGEKVRPSAAPRTAV